MHVSTLLDEEVDQNKAANMSSSQDKEGGRHSGLCASINACQLISVRQMQQRMEESTGQRNRRRWILGYHANIIGVRQHVVTEITIISFGT